MSVLSTSVLIYLYGYLTTCIVNCVVELFSITNAEIKITGNQKCLQKAREIFRTGKSQKYSLGNIFCLFRNCEKIDILSPSCRKHFYGSIIIFHSEMVWDILYIDVYAYASIYAVR